ncbi:MAG: amidohydrolase [Tissierellia bacterium]|nr:amidohydrolase [Tissierellia bacterium]
MINIVDEAKKLQDEIVSWRRDLHQIPEIGLELPKTAAYVTERLDEMGIEYKANVKLLFQPAEEGPGGAKPMIEEGALEDPKVDAALGLHIGGIFEEVGTGQVGYSGGNIMACLDSFRIKVKGSGCHGAMPDTGVDPIAIAAQVVTALQTIVSREMKPTNPAVVTIGTIHGGSAYNIIPNSVDIEGTVRALDQDTREKIASSIESIVAGITKGMHGDYEYEYTFGYPPVSNDPEFTEGFLDTVRKVIDEEDMIEIKDPTMGGEDMAYYLEEVPGTFFFLGGFNKEKGIVYPHHHPKFMVDEDVFWKGTALMAQGALDWLAKQ